MHHSGSLQYVLSLLSFDVTVHVLDYIIAHDLHRRGAMGAILGPKIGFEASA